MHARVRTAGLGRSLCEGSDELDVQPGTQAEVPLWLVRPLLRRAMASIKLPMVYGERYQRKLNAGADCVSLRSMVRACSQPSTPHSGLCYPQKLWQPCVLS